MKITLTMEDMPGGYYPTLNWEASGHTDELSESLSALLVAKMTDLLKTYEEAGLVKIIDKEAPGANGQNTFRH